MRWLRKEGQLHAQDTSGMRVLDLLVPYGGIARVHVVLQSRQIALVSCFVLTNHTVLKK